MLRRHLLTAAVLIAGVSAPMLPSAAGNDPATFINRLGNQLQLVAGNPSPEQRRAGFRQLFLEDFDVPGLGRFVLGRFSRIMTPEQQREFLAVFENYVVATYSDRLSDYVAGGVVPRIISSRPAPDGAIVSSEFVRGPSTGGAIRVDWRLSECAGTYKISDIVIDGLSMAANGRSELEGVAERNGAQPLAILAVMRQEAANALLR
jgi:phospholipid transport system substrate-binding protein